MIFLLILINYIKLELYLGAESGLHERRLLNDLLVNYIKLELYLGAESGLHERRLLNDLLVNYNKLERPVVNESDAVVLTFGLTLQQIIDVVSTAE